MARAVRRPNEIVDILRSVGEVLRFAAGAAEQPDLRLAFIAGGEESEVLAVGAPARMRGRDTLSTHSDCIAAREGRHPNAFFALIFLQTQRLDAVCHPLRVRT